MEDDLIGKKIDYLFVLEKYSTKEYICQCDCGNKVIVKLDFLNNKKNKKSCGCQVSKQQLPSLYTLWKRFSKDEKNNWVTWESFVIWSKQQNFCEAFSIHKKDRKTSYNKENLEFGLFVNKEFFTIQQLKDKKYTYNEREKKFVTSKRIKSLIVSEDEVTKAFNKQKNKHKTLPKKIFEKTFKGGK